MVRRKRVHGRLISRAENNAKAALIWAAFVFVDIRGRPTAPQSRQ
jgi:hypothetical protein